MTSSEKVTAFTSYKNLVVLGLGYLFLFSAFAALQNLQTSLHEEELGFAALCTIYGAFLLSCLVIPNVLIKWIGSKYTLMVSMIGFVLYTVANFHPTWPILITAAALLGLSAAPLWTAQASYTTTIAINHSDSAGLEKDAVISKFFCIFYLLFQFGQAIGNAVSSVVLKTSTDRNATAVILDCGAAYCPVGSTNSTQNKDSVEKNKVMTLLSIYVTFGGVAIACIFFFLDRVKPITSKGEKESTISESIVATVKMLKDYRIWLMVPITMFTGLEQAFAFGDLTNAFVSCKMGIDSVGFIMICFGIVGAFSSLVVGMIVKYTGTFMLVIFAFLAHAALLVWCLFWKTHYHPEILFFISAGMWGLLDSIWATQINALYGIIFAENKDPAFAHFKLWQSLGFVVNFAYGTHLCTAVKIYVLISILTLGTLCYCVVEYLQRKNKKLDIITNATEMTKF